MKFTKSLVSVIIFLTSSCNILGQTSDSTGTKIQIINPTFFLDFNNRNLLDIKRDSLTFSRGYLWTSGRYGTPNINEKIVLFRNGVSVNGVNSDSVVQYTSKHISKIPPPTFPLPKLLTLHADEYFPINLSFWNAEQPVWYTGTITPVITGNNNEQTSYDFYQSLLIFHMYQGLPSINGKLVKLNVVKYKSDYEEIVKMKSDIMALQAANVNTVVVQELNFKWLHLCDSLGMYVVMEHSLTKKNGQSLKEYIRLFNDDVNTAQFVPNIKFGSLIFFYVDTDLQTQLRTLNQTIPFFARNPKTFYGRNEVAKLDIPRAKTYHGDSAATSRSNSNTLRFLSDKYRFIDYSLTDMTDVAITVTNNFDFISAAGIKFKWKLLHGSVIQEGDGVLPNLPAGESIKIKLGLKIEKIVDDSGYAIEVSFLPKDIGDFHGRVHVTQPHYQEYFTPKNN